MAKEQSQSLLPPAVPAKITRYNSGESTCHSASSCDGSSSGLGTDEATSGKGSAHGGDDDEDSDASEELKEVTVQLTDAKVDVARYTPTKRSVDL